jgi:hypothetical protein
LIKRSSASLPSFLPSVIHSFFEHLQVIVKLDIDSPDIELALVEQLQSSTELIKLVDVFYFEHHVHLMELAGAWVDTMRGSVQSSLEFFASLRHQGVDAHFWP